MNRSKLAQSIPLDEAAFRQAVSQTGIPITALIYCRSFLDANPQVAAMHRQNIKDRIVLAGKLGVPVVSMSTGRAPGLTLEAALAAERLIFWGKRYCRSRGNAASRFRLKTAPT